MKLGTFRSLRPPPGVDFPRQPPVFLAAGHRVSIETEGVGRLINPEEDVA